MTKGIDMEHVYVIVGIAVSVSTLITFIGTKLWDAYAMQKKYVTKEDFEMCHANREETVAAFKAAGKSLTDALIKVEKRLMLGNLVMAELCEKAEIPPEKILVFERALGIKLRDNG